MANIDMKILKSKNRWYNYFYACPDCDASITDPVCPYCGETTNLYTEKYYKWLDKCEIKETIENNNI